MNKKLIELLENYKAKGLELDEEESKLDEGLLSVEEINTHNIKLHEYSVLEDSIIKMLCEEYGLTLYETSLVLDGKSLDEVVANKGNW